MDGEIVATFIKTGILDASLIKAGIIQSSDGSFKLSLTSGHMTTYSDGKIAIDIFNQTMAWHDWQGDAGLTGQIASNRILDAQGNPTGKQVLSIQVPHGVMLDLASIDEDAKSPVIRIDNYASDSERQKITMHVDDLYITPKNAPDYGVSYIDGVLKLGGHIDMNGYGFKNLGKMNMSTGTGMSDDGWNGTITVNGITITVTNGVITDAVS
jgi:hypothetical protein